MKEEKGVVCRQELHADVGTAPGSESRCPPREGQRLQPSTAGRGAGLPGLHPHGWVTLGRRSPAAAARLPVTSLCKT